LATEPEPSHGTAWLELLEGRRLAADVQLWHGPTLVIAAQAFLLQVLTDPSLHVLTAVMVAVAGSFACVAAFVSIVQQGDRELTFSETVAAYSRDVLHLGDPRRHVLEAKLGQLDGVWPEWLVRGKVLKARRLWLLTLVALVVADWVAFAMTRW
jgi:hypothetical protein